MSKKKILISAGPIPAMLDSVKIITNKFKGGLMVKAAETLSDEFEITVVRSITSDVKTHLPTIDVKDVYDYYSLIERTHADAYVLGGAIANLAPALPLPWGEGKFPSHNYAVGDTFDIKFTIAPRAIDMVKKWHPRATLIGYKLFDGSENELMDAAWHTLVDSRSNVVFANHPKTAKSEKIAMMPDGTHMRMSFDDHVNFIRRVIKLEWYQTKIDSEIGDGSGLELARLRETIARIQFPQRGYNFGTVAVRCLRGGFLTTTRGKREDGHCRVVSVDHEMRVVKANAKATLNAPTLDKLFHSYPKVNFILHSHRQLEGVHTYPYKFSGTTEETQLAEGIGLTGYIPQFNVENHGYYVAFQTYEEVQGWLNANYPR